MYHKRDFSGSIERKTAVGVIFVNAVKNTVNAVKNAYSSGARAVKIGISNTNSNTILTRGSSRCTIELPGKYCPSVIS